MYYFILDEDYPVGQQYRVLMAISNDRNLDLDICGAPTASIAAEAISYLNGGSIPGNSHLINWS